MSLVGWIVVAAIALVLFWLSMTTLVAIYELPLVTAFAVATVQCATIPLALAFPKTATPLQLAAVITMGVATASVRGEPWPLPILGLVTLSVFLCVVAVRERWTFSIVVWWLSFGALVVVILRDPTTLAIGDRWGYNLLIDATVTLLVLGGSVAVGQRQRIRAELAAARRDVELEQARRLYVEERGRIARELHDVVAHSMSIVHIQATSAKFRLDGLDERAAAEFDDIARSARTALREMRQLLGALRTDEDGQRKHPQPQLSDIETLTLGAARVGTHTTVTIADDLRDVTPIVQLTVYRIVQEALSNAVRHAPNADADIDIHATPQGKLVVSVQNGPPPGARRESALVPDGGGMGLRGMRERVSLLGGTLDSRPTPAGGFRVVATIPPVADGQEELE